MADQPTRSGADSGPPAGDRPLGRPSDDPDPVAPLTVAELLARSGTGVRRRRAERRESGELTGRRQPLGDDGLPPDRPQLRGGVRWDLAPQPATPAATVLPTGWQPAMPDPVAPPADDPPRPPADARPQPPARPSPGRPFPARLSPARPTPARPTPARPSPAAPAATPPAAPVTPSRPSPAAAPPVPPRPAPRPAPRAVPAEAARVATPPAVAPAPRIVPPVSVTAAAPPPPVPGSPPASPYPSAPVGPYPSVPVSGVRRSLPLPPIPGRDLVAPGPADETADERPRTPAGPVRRRLTRLALALVALLGVVASYYVGLYFYVDTRIDHVDALVTDGPEVLAPQLQESAQNYLVVGTDLPGRRGLAGVSALIAHVSPDRDDAVLVTVPPTALSDTPMCRDSDGEVRPAVTEPFASALLDGGPSCLVRSVQQLSGLRIDHYLSVDLSRLPGMVDALGDVEVCLPESSAAEGAGLALPAGENRLTGEEAAAFLRSGGVASDVTGAAAAHREHLVLTSTLGTALAGGTLADPLTLTRFLARAGDALTVDADTTLADVRALGVTLGDLPRDAVDHGELPVSRVGYVPTGSDQAAVVVDAAATRELFDAVIDEGRLPDADVSEVPAAQSSTGDGSTGTGAADSLPDPAVTDPVPEGTTVSVAPAGVTLDVLDATGGERTAEVADGLAAAGFRIAARGVEPAAVDRTVVRYGPAALEPARTVAAAVPGAVLQETDAVGGAVQLVIGPDHTALSPVGIGTPVPTSAAPAAVDAAAGATASCS